ncbi:hypothetical protein F5J12DRAFT_725248 [Pisolithus orientalis]|uniref:uncharacterized protein n=1 Tax=Pisolithus orientalis TaxID=936130 RepID=UPI0022248886|nr:uncharacterized protein F5J12DRAFT_725248 [Pisolithus orientalis]KAI5997212.1 hypothetical protein F5J12DRAFT_725248 [Pisolithus orientalis]
MSAQFPDGHLALKDLADHLIKEFRGRERNVDLDAVITLGRTALECTPPEHSQRHYALINLADLLSERSKKKRTKEDLDEVIMIRRVVSEYMVPNDPHRQRILLELDDCLHERFRREDSMADLEEIISLRRAALERTPLPDRCRPLLDLASALHEQFQRQGPANIMSEAVSLAQAAWELHRPGHPDHVLSRDLLASYLKTKVRAGSAPAHVKEPGASSSGFNSLNIKQLIKRAVSKTVEKIPHRLLHTPTGLLCNRDAQVSRFEGSHQYKQLLLSTSPLNSQQLVTEIDDVLSEFFEFATLSHKWGIREP